jgi:hypothetical protein
MEGTEDRYARLKDAIGAAVQQDDFPEGAVERFELVCHASGEVTWRAWTPRSDMPTGGHIASAS